MAGVDATARELSTGLEDANLEVSGAFSSSGVLEANLRGGLYQDADVTEYLVDWYVPWVDALRTRTYKIGLHRRTGEKFAVEFQSLSARLKTRNGGIVTRNCNAELGDDRCGIDLSAITDGQFDNDVTAVDPDEPRRKFDANGWTGATLVADDWFSFGKLVWLTGNNADVGHVSVVKDYVHSGREVELYDDCPFDIEVGDEFRTDTGCNKLAGINSTEGHCKNKFSNLVNFRGYPFKPGADRALRTPTT